MNDEVLLVHERAERVARNPSTGTGRWACQFRIALTKNAGTKLLGRAHGLFLLFELVGGRTGGHGVDTQSPGMADGLVVTLGRGMFVGTARR